jgi:hypothetical protein
VGNKGYIGTKGPPINTEKGKISGDNGSTGLFLTGPLLPETIPCSVLMAGPFSPI